MFCVVLITLFASALGVLHRADIRPRVMVGYTNGSSITISAAEPGGVFASPTNFLGFKRGLDVTYIYEWDMYVAVGEPNASAAVPVSVAYSSNAVDWIGVSGSATLCPCGYAVQYGRGRVLVGCSNQFDTLDEKQLVLRPFPTSNPMIMFSDRSMSSPTVVGGGLTNVISAVRKISYSELDASFVALGRGIGASLVGVAYSSDGGLTWNAALKDPNLNTRTLAILLPTDMTYSESGGFFITTYGIERDQLDSHKILRSVDGGKTFGLVDAATTSVAIGKRVASIAFANPSDKIVAYSIDGVLATKKRLNAPKINNQATFSFQDGSLTASIPTDNFNQQAVDDPIVARYLPFEDIIYIGGRNRIAETDADATSYAFFEACPRGQECLLKDSQQTLADMRSVSTSVKTSRQQGFPGPPGGDNGENNLNRTGGLFFVYGVAGPQIVRFNGVDNVPPSTSAVNGSVSVFRGDVLEVAQNVTVDFPQPYFRQLASINVFGGKLRVMSQGQVVVQTNLMLEKSASLHVERGHSLKVNNRMILDSTATLSIDPVVAPGETSITIVVCQYAEIEGRFALVAFNQSRRRRADGCVPVLSDPEATYSTTTLTVTTQVTGEDCSGGAGGGGSSRLSTGAIVGIAVGGAVVGVAIVILIVLVSKYLVSKHTADANAAIRFNDMGKLKSGNV